MEETALAVDALVSVLLSRRNSNSNDGVRAAYRDDGKQPIPPDHDNQGPRGGNDAAHQAIIRGVEFLIDSVEHHHHRVPWPIGFYFAKLWYHEKLYPLIFATTALGKYLRLAADD